MIIGSWIKRKIAYAKWHLVESIVDGDAITKCGRRMDKITPGGRGLEVRDVMPLTRMIGQPQNCSNCDTA